MMMMMCTTVEAHLNCFIDAFHHDETDVRVAIAESPRTELLLFFVDLLTHEHVRKSFTVDEFDEVKRVPLCRQRISQRAAAFFLLFEHLQYDTVKPRRVDVAVFIIHRLFYTHTYRTVIATVTQYC